MKYSEYYNMNLPENSDYALIEPLNENTQAIDAELKNRENALIAHDASVESHPDILVQIRNINDGMDNVYTKPETDDLVSGAVSTHNADEAAQALAAGKLDFDPNVHCDHHHHGEGHSCGHHSCG